MSKKAIEAVEIEEVDESLASEIVDTVEIEEVDAQEAGFVILKRDPEIYSPPYEVAVPPSEVENYKAGGYEPV